MDTDNNTANHSPAKRRVCQTAARLFKNNGFDAVSVAQILAEANIARSSFYRFFTDKEDLLKQITVPVFEQLASQTKTIDLDKPENIINAICDKYISTWRRHGDALSLTASLGERIYHLVRTPHDEYADGIYQAMKTLNDNRMLRNDDAMQSAILLAQTGVKILLIYEAKPHFENIYTSTIRGMLLKWG